MLSHSKRNVLALSCVCLERRETQPQAFILFLDEKDIFIDINVVAESLASFYVHQSYLKLLFRNIINRLYENN